MTARKLSPVEARDAAIIAGAVAYRVTLFLGRGMYKRSEAETFDAAKTEAQRLEGEHPGRRAAIYAVDAAGQSTIVPR